MDSRSPVFGIGEVVRGKVLLARSEFIARVIVKLDGHLRIQENGGAGRNNEKIIDKEATIWTSDGPDSACPSSLDFALPLPITYDKGGKEHALPPTTEVHLSGVPGFKAEVSYSISVHVHKSKGFLFGGQVSVSAPFTYFPRTRPHHPTPPPTSATTFSNHLVHASPGWEIVESVMDSRSHYTNPIAIKLFIPAGRTYSLTTPIPFRLHITSNAFSLASFLPSAPTSSSEGNKRGTKAFTRVFVIRQVSVDVQNAHAGNVKTDIFKSLLGGEGVFRRLGDGPDWAAWEGEITLDPSVVKVASFKAGGLWLKDMIVLSIVPPNPTSSPLQDLRKAIPIRIVTEQHASQAAVDQVTDWSEGDLKLDIPDL